MHRVLLLLVLAGCASRPIDDASAALRELCAHPALAGARIGVAIVDAADGRTLFEHDADRGFAPASNQKLLTAAIALQVLGPEHRLATELWAAGELRDGELRGELRLRGYGDPTLGDGAVGAAALQPLVASLQGIGVRRFTGRIVGDGSWLGGEHLGLGWQWDYLDEDYAPPFGGLCWHHNTVCVVVEPGPSSPVVVVSPPWFTDVRSDLVAANDGQPSQVTARRRLGRTTIEVAGRIAALDRPPPVSVPVLDPAAFAAQALGAALAAAGIAKERVESGGADAGAAAGSRLVGTVLSEPVAAIVEPMLRDSDNLFAEQLWRVAARTAAGDGGTAAAAAHAEAVLRELGVDTVGLVMADGSGLSRRNLVRPRQLARVLTAAWHAPWRAAFVAGLPIAGRTGTLRGRFREGPAHGLVRAKTGYISRVVCLSGYLPRPDADPLVFVVMVNDFTGGDDAGAKAAVDMFVQRLAADIAVASL